MCDLNPDDTITVLVSRPNHRLGNLLLITPLLQDICNSFPKARVDLFLKGDISSSLFGDNPNVNRIIHLPRKPFKKLGEYVRIWVFLRRTRYDLVINVDRASSSGTLSTQFARSRYKIFGEYLQDVSNLSNDQKHIAKSPVLAFRTFLSGAGISTSAVIPRLNLTLKPEELAAGKKIVEGLVPQPGRKTICLFTFATGDKCYAKDWWEHFYQLLEENFKDCNFLEVLPVERISNLSFQIPYFYSRDVRELASVIANTSVFIGADSGIMHLASAVQTPTVGLFSITDVSKYRPYGEGCIAIDTNQISQEASIGRIREVVDGI